MTHLEGFPNSEIDKKQIVQGQFLLPKKVESVLDGDLKFNNSGIPIVYLKDGSRIEWRKNLKTNTPNVRLYVPYITLWNLDNFGAVVSNRSITLISHSSTESWITGLVIEQGRKARTFSGESFLFSNEVRKAAFVARQAYKNSLSSS